MNREITLGSNHAEFESNSPSAERNNMGDRNNTISVDDAVIQSISRRQGSGYVTIQYPVSGRNTMTHIQVVTLITSRNTRMRDQFGNPIGLRDLREGMVVSARFSSMMTRSQPPQSRAFSIMVVQENESSIIEEGRVLEVESSRGFNYLLTGQEDNIYSQVRYTITNATLIRDRRGNPIPLRSIRPGQLVRIERASFQTMSIPPQTTALTVQVISS
ncbi:hypothetical protein FRZ06_15520 [Anoxybacterium hadale]|uniref:Uncharacterized protein n=1 Tax=Anoxybacterium hadale TaxID=3408580 RepID=A0ACD1AEK1_9FIRM|nr:hypothetical protein FRZ06_15520 [Clostridiales bacterium]